MNYINHITLSTGHCRRSPRAEVSDETLALLQPWLKQALASGNIEPLPAESLAHYGASIVKDVGLIVTIHGPQGPHIPGRPHSGEWLPIATMGVAQRSREAEDLWAQLAANFGAQPGLKPPTTPWAAVSVHETISDYLDALEWLGDFERCVAWAWLTRNPALREAT